MFSHIDHGQGGGQWQFVLRAKDGTQRFEAKDAEPELPSERLDLLTVVRALESLDQPSRVTLVECSDYVWKGVRYGLPEWRTNGWRWEFFGQMVPVKNSDLWQRLDRALRFHDVECQRRRFDRPSFPQEGVKKPHWNTKLARGLRERLSDWLKYATSVVQLDWRRRLRMVRQSFQRWASARNAPRTTILAHPDVNTSAS
ncbi:MAG: RNase H family protein [Thermoguttaceae bacterium]